VPRVRHQQRRQIALEQVREDLNRRQAGVGSTPEGAYCVSSCGYWMWTIFATDGTPFRLRMNNR
jgi:hypothetical protein